MSDRKHSSDTREQGHLTQWKPPAERTNCAAGARWKRVMVIATPMVVITMVIYYSDYIDDNDADGGGW